VSRENNGVLQQQSYVVMKSCIKKVQQTYLETVGC